MIPASLSSRDDQSAGRKGIELTLAQRFAIAGGPILLLGTLGIGEWVARQIEDGVTKNAAISTALYVDSFIAPLTRELETSDTLSIGPIRALDEAFRGSPLGGRLVSVKIWREDGTIIYSPDYQTIGEKFPPTEELRRAYAGEVVSGFDDLDDEEDVKERESGLPLLEIYSPVRAPWSGKVIAVAEFYEDGTELRDSVARAVRNSWLVVSTAMLSMGALLMGIVYQGSRTISRQRARLSAQLTEVIRTSEQNRKLREQAQNASKRVAELNEVFLRRTSAELHDGPAQLLAAAALRIDQAGKIEDARLRRKEVATIKNTLENAMLDIRNISRGLSLPELAELSIQATVDKVVKAHIDRTSTQVEVDLPQAEIEASQPEKICAYRFVQETLNNAWQHAGGKMQSVTVAFEAPLLTISVSDGGPGFEFGEASRGGGMGLYGLRERIESLDGELLVDSTFAGGTQITMKLPLSTGRS